MIEQPDIVYRKMAMDLTLASRTPTASLSGTREILERSQEIYEWLKGKDHEGSSIIRRV